MCSLTNVCFMCTNDNDCSVIDDKIVTQVQYVLPEITIINMGIPLWACSFCGDKLQSFVEFKHVCLENSQHLEARLRASSDRQTDTPDTIVKEEETTMDNPYDREYYQGIVKSIIKEEISQSTSSTSNAITDGVTVRVHNQKENDSYGGSFEDLCVVQIIEQDGIVENNKNIVTNQTKTNFDEVYVKGEPLETNSTHSDDSNNVDNNFECSTSTNTENQVFKCEVCGKIFPRSFDLSIHMIGHTERKDFKCEFCTKAFRLASELNKHKKIHQGAEDMKCSVCDTRFVRRDELSRHLKTHSGNKTFPCPVCYKPFWRKHHMLEHMKTHTGKKDFQCDVCTKLFSCKSHLNAHMKVHIGKKDFTCEICQKSFTYKSNLKSHIKCHTSDEIEMHRNQNK